MFHFKIQKKLSFQELNISKKLIEKLDALKINIPTEVQRSAIPPTLQGKDVLAISPTGSGKTEAYSIPIINRFISENDTNRAVLVLSPTRELAIQTQQRMTMLVPDGTGIAILNIIGGQAYETQIESLNNQPQIIVATPGRLIDLLDQKEFELDRFDTIVIDEADEMLKLGFLTVLFQILGFLPRNRQTLLFSATFPKELKNECAKILRNPTQIQVTHKGHYQSGTHEHLLFVDKNDKKDLIRHLIEDQNMAQALIFTRTTHGVDRIVKDLISKGYSAQGLYGDKSQSTRNTILGDFKSGKFRFLIATDIASRGLHLEDLHYVINYELPDNAEQYTHRIGRVGRSSTVGCTYTFCDAEDNANLIKLQIELKKNIPILENHPHVLSWEKMLTHNQLAKKRKGSSHQKRK